MRIIAWAPVIKTKQRRREFNNVIRHHEWDDGALIRFSVHEYRRLGRDWIGKDAIVVQWNGRTIRTPHDGTPNIAQVERLAERA